MARYLVIRLSAIGDVAMTIPVIYSAARENPEDHFTVLTHHFLVSLFLNRPGNVSVIGVDTKGKEKSLAGLLRLAWKLSGMKFDYVLDLHDVLRTQIIRSILGMGGKPVFVVDKARIERKRLTRKNNKKLKPLRPVVERYADVFRAAGLNYSDSFSALLGNEPLSATVYGAVGDKSGKWIGVAPFAKHKGKIYPLEKMEKVVEILSHQKGLTLFLFGGRGEEERELKRWAAAYPHVVNVAGRFSLPEELELISKMDVLLSMDSANMHFASLVGTRVVSVWGATHPFTGFYGYKQDMKDAIQLPLSCRPCSVFGNKPCWRGDHACMTTLSTGLIIEDILTISK